MNLLKLFLINDGVKKDKLIIILKNIIMFGFCFWVFAVPVNKLSSKIFFYLGISLWLFITILVRKVKFYKDFIPKTILNKLLLIFLVSGVLSVIFSIDFGLSQRIFFERYIVYCLFFWFSYAIIADSKRNLNLIVILLTTLGILFGLGALRDYFIFKPERLSSFFGIKPNFAVYLALLIPFNFVIIFSNVNKILKYLSLASFSLMIFLFVAHGSRGVWLGVLISIAVVVFIRKKYLILIIILIIFSSCFYSKILPNEIKGRVESLTNIYNNAAVNERLYFSVLAFNIFKEHPIFGAGLGAFGKLNSKIEKPIHIHTHNMFAEVMAEMGIVGLLAFLSIVFTFLVRFIKNLYIWGKTRGCEKITATAAGAAIFACFILNLSYSSILVGFQDALMFWLILAIAVNDKVFDMELGSSREGALK